MTEPEKGRTLPRPKKHTEQAKFSVREFSLAYILVSNPCSCLSFIGLCSVKILLLVSKLHVPVC